MMRRRRPWAVMALAVLAGCSASIPPRRETGSPASASYTPSSQPSFARPGGAAAAAEARIAFVRSTSGQDEIWVMDADGTGVERLTSQPTRGDRITAGPAWSPDGTTIAYARDGRDGRPSTLWVVAGGGEPPQRLTGHDGPIAGLAWSYDGLWIAFIAVAGGAEGAAEATDSSVVVVGVHGERVRLADGGPGLEAAPRWSADGRAVAYEREGALHWSPAGGDAPERRLFRPVDGAGFAVSPDGARVAYETGRDVVLMNLDGTKAWTLTGGLAGAGPAAAPAWSPDGSRISVERAGDIWVIGTDGTRASRVTPRREPDFGARWAPDGIRVLYRSGRCGPRSCRVQLRSAAADGSDDVAVARAAGDYRFPAWLG